jgi:hypothetical protein
MQEFGKINKFGMHHSGELALAGESRIRLQSSWNDNKHLIKW